MFSLSDEPFEVALGSVAGHEYQTYLLGAIVNPLGPTLMAIFALRDKGQKAPLYHIFLNPFSQGCTRIGSVDLNANLSFAEMLKLNRFFEGCGCPTLAFVAGGYDESDSEEMLGLWLASFPSARQNWSRIKAYPFDPMGRIDAMMRGEEPYEGPTYESTFRDGPPIEASTDETAPLDFARMLRQPEHVVPERTVFFTAWEASIEAMAMHGMGTPDGAMSLATMVRWFLSLSLSCDVPREFYEAPSSAG